MDAFFNNEFTQSVKKVEMTQRYQKSSFSVLFFGLKAQGQSYEPIITGRQKAVGYMIRKLY